MYLESIEKALTEKGTEKENMIKEKAAMLIEKAKNSYRPRESINEIQRERTCDKPLQASRISKTKCIEKESFRGGGVFPPGTILF